MTVETTGRFGRGRHGEPTSVLPDPFGAGGTAPKLRLPVALIPA
jgi:hypothetical protein